MHDKLSCNKFGYTRRNIHSGHPEDEETIDEEVSEVLDGEFKPEVPNNDNDWEGEGIDADDKSDGYADSEYLIDVDTDVENNNEEDIEVWCAKANFFLIILISFA